MPHQGFSPSPHSIHEELPKTLPYLSPCIQQQLRLRSERGLACRYGLLAVEKVLTPLGLQSQRTQQALPNHREIQISGSRKQSSGGGSETPTQRQLQPREEACFPASPETRGQEGSFDTPPTSRRSCHSYQTGSPIGKSPVFGPRQVNF